MEINILKRDLEKGLQKIIGIVNPKPPIPTLAYVQLEAEENKLFLTGTDLEINIKTSCPCQTKEKGNILVLGKKFYNLIREFPEGEIKIKEEKKRVSLSTDNINFLLLGIDSKEFPSFPQQKETNSFMIKGEELKENLQKIRFCVGYDETRPYISGILLEIKEKNLFFVGTDTKRLVLIKKPVELNFETRVIMPLKLVNELEGILDGEEEVKIGVGKNQIFIETKETNILSRLLEGEFPDYNQVVPSGENLKKVKIKKEDFFKALRRLSVLTSEKFSAVKLKTQKKDLLLSVDSPEFGTGKEKVGIDYQGEETEITFNPFYILDILKYLKGEEVFLGVDSSYTPAKMWSEEEVNYIYILMPMKLE